jgi:endogenous inhibitor of DNA gyrase (YacG/DUF329 family)
MLDFLKNQQRSRSGTTHPCPICGELVYSLPHRPQQFCSHDCASRAKASRLVIKHCPQCQTVMRLRPSESRTRYCSLACASLGRVKRPMGRMHNGKPVRLLADGYLKIWEPSHPRATRGWILEHRWVMEQSLGRYLDTHEEVDHINTVRSDNRIENLQVLGKSDHRRKTGKDTRTARLTMRERLAEYERKFGPLT